MRNHKAEASSLTAQAAPLAAIVKATSAAVDSDDDGKAISDAPSSLTQDSGSKPKSDGAATPVPHLGAPMVIGAGQAGLGLIAGQAIQIVTQESALLATGRDLNLSSGNQLTIHAAQAIGLISGAAKAGDKNAGLTAIAAKVPVTLQAQADTLNLDSQKGLTMVSANASAEFAAAASIRLATSQGASIKIEGGNITVQCPGTLTVHAAKQAFTPGTQLSKEMQKWPNTNFEGSFRFINEETGEAIPELAHIISHRGSDQSAKAKDDGTTATLKDTGVEQLGVQVDWKAVVKRLRE